MTPPSSHYDVIVSGGGPAGVAAALSAARRGARTLLVERYGFCGGMATAGLVNPWAGHAWHDHVDEQGGRRASLTGGIFKEVALRLQQGGGYGSALSDSAFDEELLKRVYDALLMEAGVIVRYHSYITGVQLEGRRLLSISLASKGGSESFSANNFIDASGDADLAALAGCGFTIGRPEDGLTQAMTVSFRMANVDKSAMLATGSLRKARALIEPYFQKALAAGDLHYPYRNFIHFYDYPRPGVLHFNMTRINHVSGLSAEDLSAAEMEGRRQAYVMSDWLCKAVPCFSEAYLEKIACQVGVRETRHIHGLHTMTQEDIVQARKFPDGIARSRYFIDIHNPAGAKDVHQQEGAKGQVKAEYGPPKDDYYEVPFRSLVPVDCPNLLVACRALSATHEAAAAVRVMATMHGIGEAAGIAVAEATLRHCAVSEIPGEWVRDQIPYMAEGPDFGPPWNGSSSA
ncbi:FAD dependent oxidoreductase [Prosthecobacter fusiformis]|uniref:FAD dependent oxidoreductase n=1 Tax=Prosthecobacter fusiformis TaxID=48464 RepID=A0A4R7SSH9_9BACT|nr:FAD-dependent oxidoreductase [Prosthecobacter fusiformis]TDU81725.1 FAD dependent oxidoreductase [Prosthecobacter fusiformis]